ncbi:MAG: 4-hydroxy-tetrahydrodipicolinate reductase [Cyclobacteriaceae bacterium]|nr:4-hydroxy-tetrahydrodipicolinate reductase [Cyclobacteriaceae bacterium]
MKILLIGYGKMGKAIEAVAKSRSHEIAILDPVAGHHFDFKNSVDVAIEFTMPEAAPKNIRLCIDHGIPVLSGTTGWLKDKASVDSHCQHKNGTFFYASNFSLGVNLFFRLNEHLAKMMASFQGYDVSIDEVHHTQKKDAPSGTAITLAEGILKHLPFKKQWVNNETHTPSDLVIRSFREDPMPGTHTVTYHSAVDDVEIKHTAHSREGFAVGAVAVAEWLPGRKGVLGMNDFLTF